MKDIIYVTVGKDHIFETTTKVIGREGESLTSCFRITLADEEMWSCWAYLDFEKANGEKFKSKNLDIVDGIIEYDIPASVLTEDGELGVQLVLQREDGLIWKTYDKKFLNRKSIDAVDEIPNKEDFVAEMQEAIDKVYDIEEKVDNIDPRLLELNLENVATKEYVDGLVSGKLKREFIDGELGDPAMFDTNTIYMLQSKNSGENNIYEEYMVIDGKWELIGSTAVDLSGYATKEDLKAKADKRKFEPIRTFIIGDETTYRTHDMITYLDGDETGTQITKINIVETDDNRPIKLKYVYVKIYIPTRTDVTNNYTVACLPYGLITTDGDGFAKGTLGYKLVNHSGTCKPSESAYSSCEVRFTEDYRYTFGYSTYFVNNDDAYSTRRGWEKNPFLLDKDTWGRLIMQNKCNDVCLYVSTTGVAFPEGTKVEIFGEEA